MLVGRIFPSAHAPQGGSFFGCLTVQEVKTQWRSEYGANVGEEEESGPYARFQIAIVGVDMTVSGLWVWVIGVVGRVASRCGAVRVEFAALSLTCEVRCLYEF